ncbi:MAG: metalloregulator ArsR/SmtB family transcription factor [Thiohalophilus sp.]|nr:metalloregulator ArsR/SmtB family transcription factor [Thiohalophilus sp.]MDZ7663549.1 metalloregulator ArsR/SmtB family transcription factor [Thiohalophilus sp.]
MMINSDSLFSALAHLLRLRALLLMQQEGELCVCELTHALTDDISRHLAQSRQAGLVSDRRQGLWVYYRLQPGASRVGAAGTGGDGTGRGRPDALRC